jgi:hypothetical protein
MLMTYGKLLFEIGHILNPTLSCLAMICNYLINRPSLLFTIMNALIKVKRLLLRYFPPGLIIEYEIDGAFRSKHLDLLDLDLQ